MKKIISAFLAAIMMVSMMNTVAFAAEPTAEQAGYLTMSIEASTLGLGFIEEPTKVPFYEGENVAQVFARFLEDKERDYEYTGTIEGSFYLSQLQTDWTEEEMNTSMNIPQCLLDAFGTNQEDYIATGGNGDGTLGEFSYGMMSGWMITSAKCKGLTPVGTSLWDAVDGDTIRWQFTLEGYGGDLGYNNGWGTAPVYLQPDKDALYAILGAVNADPDAKAKLDNYDELIQTATTIDATQEAIDTAVATIYEATGVSYDYIAVAAGKKVTVPAKDTSDQTDSTTPAPSTPTANQAAIDKMNGALDYIYSVVPEPSLGTNGGEWAIIALGRAGYDVSDTYYDDYVARIVQSMIDENGVLHNVKKTENSRVIMALSAIGVEPFDIGGYDVTADLSDFSNVCKQGINGPVFALIAMDTNDYTFKANADANDQTTRKKILEYIISKEITGGGYALSGTTPDPDMTAMTLQSLSNYVDGNDMLKAEFGTDTAGYEDMISTVKAIVDRGITVLSNLQQDDGDFASWGTVNVESTAQTVVTLTGLGIDPMTDERFITSTGKTLLDGILKYSDETGGFKHIADGSVNQMATEQATYALVAYSRLVNGENGLYDMVDAFEDDTTTPPTPVVPQADVIITTPEQIVGETGTEFNAVVTANKWTDSTIKLIDGIYNIPEELEVVAITMGESVTGGSLDYNLADGKLRFAYLGENLGDVTLSTETFPVELMTITLKLTEDVTEETEFTITTDSLTIKSDSESSEDLDVEDAADDVTATVPGPKPVASARVLYTGDDTDLIAADKQAVAVEILNLEENSKVMFGETEMMYSKEMTDKKSVDTYVALVGDDVTVEQLSDISNYTITEETPAAITFADVNDDTTINAQDALDTLSFWLRKTEIETDKQILTANVNADSAITTTDVLAIMEFVVNARALDVISK